MDLLEKIAERLTPKSRKLETQLEYVNREDKGMGYVDVLVYEYNKITRERRYLHTVPVRTVPEDTLIDYREK